MIEDKDLHFLDASTKQGYEDSTFKELFNAFQLKPIDLTIKSEKALMEMSDEELLAWVHKMDDFIRVTKVASTSARVRLEDRKLQLTNEQREALAKLDRAYKPRVAKVERVKKEKVEVEGAWRPVTAEEKKVAAAMKILGMSKEDAEAWVAAQSGVK